MIPALRERLNVQSARIADSRLFVQRSSEPAGRQFQVDAVAGGGGKISRLAAPRVGRERPFITPWRMFRLPTPAPG